MLFIALASLLPRNWQTYCALTENVLIDGLTLTLWQVGKNAIYDMTVTEILAMSYLNINLIIASSATEQASARKEVKYAALALSHSFISVVRETMGPIDSKTSSFCNS